MLLKWNVKFHSTCHLNYLPSENKNTKQNLLTERHFFFTCFQQFVSPKSINFFNRILDMKWLNVTQWHFSLSLPLQGGQNLHTSLLKNMTLKCLQNVDIMVLLHGNCNNECICFRIDIGRCGVSANETTLYPNNNLKK